MCAICLAAVSTGITSTVGMSKYSNQLHLENIFAPKRIFKGILIVLFLYSFLPILAPIIDKLGFSFLSGSIYNVYFFFCHQKASHSFHIFDLQFAYCARDTFIWSAIFFMALLKYLFNYKMIKIRWVILLCLPLIIDGGTQLMSLMLNALIQTPNFYESTNLLRAVTGTLFGIGLGGSLFAYLFDTLNICSNPYRLTTKKAITMTVLFSGSLFIIIYLAEILTCTTYKPLNVFDSAPRNYGYKLIEEPRLLHK